MVKDRKKIRIILTISLVISLTFLLLIVIFLGTLNTGVNIFDKIQIKKTIPQNIITQADNHIISNVGIEYFQRNYKYDSEKSYVCEPSLPTYCLYYEYLPITKLTGEKQYLVAEARNSGILYMNGVHDCVNKKNLCEFNISKQEAAEIAKQKGFNVNKDYSNLRISHTLNPFKRWAWHISETIESSSDRRTYKKMYIELTTGETSDIETETVVN